MTEKVLRVAIVGYGKMGREIANSAPDLGFEVGGVIDTNVPEDKAIEKLRASDVALVFTSPQGALPQVSRALQVGIPVVCGTTGWDKQIPEAKALCNQLGGALLIASNCSLGVHLFFALNNYLGKLMQKFPVYKPSISETHHSAKLDKPSGTAVELVHQILRIRPDIEAWNLVENSPKDNELPVASIREGRVVGRHIVEYSSDLDAISIRHNAKTRLAFVQGALAAARFICGKTGFFTMQDVLAEELGKIAEL